jgi:hypothetical protein
VRRRPDSYRLAAFEGGNTIIATLLQLLVTHFAPSSALQKLALIFPLILAMKWVHLECIYYI